MSVRREGKGGALSKAPWHAGNPLGWGVQRDLRQGLSPFYFIFIIGGRRRGYTPTITRRDIATNPPWRGHDLGMTTPHPCGPRKPDGETTGHSSSRPVPHSTGRSRARYIIKPLRVFDPSTAASVDPLLAVDRATIPSSEKGRRG